MFEEIGAHFYKQWKIMSKRPGEIAWITIYPLISIFSIGILAYFVITKGSPPETMLFVLVGVIIWDIYNTGERTTSFGITLDIWNECLKHTFTGSSSLVGFILGNVLYGVFGAFIITMILSALGIVFFGFNIFTAGIFLLNFVSVFIFSVGTGLFINSLMLTKGEKYMSLIWTLPGIVMIFSGIYYPIEILPYAVQLVSLAVPTTHSLISLRSSLGFSPGLAVPEFYIGMILSLAYLAVGVAVFRWAVSRSKKTGIIIKY